jgi:hypothetical protein
VARGVHLQLAAVDVFHAGVNVVVLKECLDQWPDASLESLEDFQVAFVERLLSSMVTAERRCAPDRSLLVSSWGHPTVPLVSRPLDRRGHALPHSGRFDCADKALVDNPIDDPDSRRSQARKRRRHGGLVAPLQWPSLRLGVSVARNRRRCGRCSRCRPEGECSPHVPQAVQLAARRVPLPLDALCFSGNRFL